MLNYREIVMENESHLEVNVV